MRIDPATKYQPFEPIPLPERRWPSQTITRPPTWCSVDLRDGNQALAEPMDQMRKDALFDAIVATGFKEIEIAFPSASQTEFNFVRSLVEGGRIPDDVTIQVLTPAREAHIRRTLESLHGCRRAIVHLYNSTSTTQRRVVFKSDRKGIRDMAVTATRQIAARARDMEADIVFEYTPESFTGTELDFAKEICEAVMEAYQPDADRRIILNLPATVELSTPNVYADQIEWFASHLDGRENAILSVHPHNDRGTAVAAAELALMAGADRVEGTLFGNGERTGNVDVVTLALNMFTQGIDPGLDFSDIGRVVDIAEQCTQIPVHPRHPYAGKLVFVAFSGSHQDAIKKGLTAQGESNSGRWDVPYLPIDPADVGRAYEPVIRINSQSGKGGVAFILEHAYSVNLPPALHADFSGIVQQKADKDGTEISAQAILALFEATYLRQGPALVLERYTYQSRSTLKVMLAATVSVDGNRQEIDAVGAGPIEAFCNALKRATGFEFDVLSFQESAGSTGANAAAIAVVEIQTASGARALGVGQHENIVTASLQAVTAAVNRAMSLA